MKIIIYFLIALFIVLLNTKGMVLIGGGDSELPYLHAIESIKNLYSVWSFQNASGAYFASGLPSLIFYILCIPLTFIPFKIANYLFYTILIFLIFLSVDSLRSTFTKYYFKANFKLDKTIDILITIFSSFTLLSLILIYRGIFIEYVAFILIAYGIQRWILLLNNTTLNKPRYYLTLVPLVMLGQNIGHLIVFIFCVLAIGFFHILIIKGSTMKNFIGKFIQFGFMCLLLSSYWLVPFIDFSKNQYSNLIANDYTQYYTVEVPFQEQAKNSSFLNVLGNKTYNFIGPENGFYPTNKDNILLWLGGFSIIFFCLSGVILFKKQKKILILLSFYLLGIIIILGNYGPFSEIYKKFILDIPGMMALRAIDTKINYFIWIFQILIIQLIVLEFLKNKKDKILKIFIVLISIPSIYFVPQIVHPQYSTFTLDNSYINDVNEISKIITNKGTGRAISLPFTGYQWPTFNKNGYWGYAIYSFMTPQLSLYNPGTTAYSKFDSNYYAGIERSIKNNSIKASDFEKRDIKYIIYEKNFDYNFSDYYNFDNDEDKLEIFFRKNFIKNIYDGENISLFEIRNFSNANNQIEHLSHMLRKISVNSSNQKITLYNNDSYHKGWGIYLNIRDIFNFKELKNIDHNTDVYRNSWVLNKADFIDYIEVEYGNELKSLGYPKKLKGGVMDYKYYKTDSNGEFSLELYSFFKPQLYMFAGVALSILTIVVLLLSLIISTIITYVRKK